MSEAKKSFMSAKDVQAALDDLAAFMGLPNKARPGTLVKGADLQAWATETYERVVKPCSGCGKMWQVNRVKTETSALQVLCDTCARARKATDFSKLAE